MPNANLYGKGMIIAVEALLVASRSEEPGRKPLGPEGQGEQGQVEQPDKTTTEEMVGECKTKITLNKWGENFVADRVSWCVDSWAKITYDHRIWSNIRGYKHDFNEPPHQSYPLPEMQFSEQEKLFICAEITALLEKHVLQKVEHVPGEFVSNIFLREKRENGKYRMILNLKH